jgi:hypothetical protein
MSSLSTPQGELEPPGRSEFSLARSQDGELSPAENADLESYLRVSSVLDVMHAKARQAQGLRA